jgi:hypothetical protein
MRLCVTLLTALVAILACDAGPRAGYGQEVPQTPRVRPAARDLNEPVPLPLLGHRQPEPSSLDDPTADASRAAALAAPPPGRTNPAPFVRPSVPEPYEYRRSAGPRARVPDEALPAHVGGFRP